MVDLVLQCRIIMLQNTLRNGQSNHAYDFSSKVDLDSRHMGWVTCELPGGDHHVIKVELKGPENTLRVRQVKILGWKEGESIKILGQISASMAQQKNCEAETLRVFRLITSQVCLKTASSACIKIHCQLLFLHIFLCLINVKF